MSKEKEASNKSPERSSLGSKSREQTLLTSVDLEKLEGRTPDLTKRISGFLMKMIFVNSISFCFETKDRRFEIMKMKQMGVFIQ